MSLPQFVLLWENYLPLGTTTKLLEDRYHFRFQTQSYRWICYHCYEIKTAWGWPRGKDVINGLCCFYFNMETEWKDLQFDLSCKPVSSWGHSMKRQHGSTSLCISHENPSVSASNKEMTNWGPPLGYFHGGFIINSDTVCTNQNDLSDLAAVSSQLINVLATHQLQILRPAMAGLILPHWQMSLLFWRGPCSINKCCITLIREVKWGFEKPPHQRAISR